MNQHEILQLTTREIKVVSKVLKKKKFSNISNIKLFFQVLSDKMSFQEFLQEEVLRPLWNEICNLGNYIHHMIFEHTVEVMQSMERWYIQAPYFGMYLFFPNSIKKLMSWLCFLLI